MCLDAHDTIHFLAIDVDIALALCFRIVFGPEEFANSILYHGHNRSTDAPRIKNDALTIHSRTWKT